jgi:hypothetical protein
MLPSETEGPRIATEEKGLAIRCMASIPFSTTYSKVWSHIQTCYKGVPGYEITFVRLDQEAWARKTIEDNVVHNIAGSDVVVADVSPENNTKQPNSNVMHEVGVAVGRGVPVILIGCLGSHDHLPSNLEGSILIEYDMHALDDFKSRFSEQLKRTLDEHLGNGVRGDYTVECFTERDSIGIELLIRRSTQNIQIITTNLEYVTKLTDSIKAALERNRQNARFKVDILTMDPEADTARARAAQLGRTTRDYREELRKSLDFMRAAFPPGSRVEIVTYTSLPTQITFIIDNTIITSMIAFGRQARENLHFVLEAGRQGAGDAFIQHFRSMKALAVAANAQ